MKKNLTIIVFLIIALVAIGLIFRNSKSNNEIPKGEESVITTEDAIVAESFETKVLNPDDLYVTFDVKYPSFIKADDSFNTSIENLVKTKMDEHLKASQEYWQARLDTQIKGDNISKVPSKEDKLSFFSDFNIVQSNSIYISFVLKYGGFSGGAHGYETETSFNYDMSLKKIVMLDSLFPNDSKYLTTISNISRESLKKQFATMSDEDKANSTPEAVQEYIDNMVSMIESGTEPKIENFSVFTFTDDKVKIYFAEYQVGPYVIGMPEVEINRK
ncbi:MAG: DUF3298 domain-containing protein [Candidatus Paceibacterota bacterium]